jgi:hypothetical protein
VRAALPGRGSEQDRGTFDVVVIDGLWRSELVDIALEQVAGTGAIICDNAEGYGFYEAFLKKGMMRVDLFGYAPGIVNPHCTSIYFREGCFLFAPEQPIPEALELRP